MLMVSTKLAASKIHGIGLFAGEFIPAGTIVWQFHPRTCQVMSLEEFVQLCDDLPLHGIRDFLNYSYLKDRRVHCIIDNTRFINHGEPPNVALADANTEVALRDIEAGEELVENYYDSYDPDDFFYHPKLFSCDDKRRLLAELEKILANR